jgi:hypothetical protein
MSTMSNTEIGVYIRLYREQFEADLQAAREAALQSMQGLTAKINVDANTTDAEDSVRELREEVEGAKTTMEVDADINPAKEAIDALRADEQSQPITLQVDAAGGDVGGDDEDGGAAGGGGMSMGGMRGIFRMMMVARLAGRIGDAANESADLAEEQFETSQMPTVTPSERAEKAKKEVADAQKQLDADSHFWGWGGPKDWGRFFESGGMDSQAFGAHSVQAEDERAVAAAKADLQMAQGDKGDEDKKRAIEKAEERETTANDRQLEREAMKENRTLHQEAEETTRKKKVSERLDDQVANVEFKNLWEEAGQQDRTKKVDEEKSRKEEEQYERKEKQEHTEYERQADKEVRQERQQERHEERYHLEATSRHATEFVSGASGLNVWERMQQGAEHPAGWTNTHADAMQSHAGGGGGVFGTVAKGIDTLEHPAKTITVASEFLEKAAKTLLAAADKGKSSALALNH